MFRLRPQAKEELETFPDRHGLLEREQLIAQNSEQMDHHNYISVLNLIYRI